MSVENVKSFFKRLEEDEAFRDEFTKKETLEKGNQESILKAAAEAGYPFSMDDLKQAQEELKGVELSPEQLEKVAGGVGIGACAIYGYGFWLYDGNHDGHVYEDETYTGGVVGVCFILGFN